VPDSLKRTDLPWQARKVRTGNTSKPLTEATVGRATPAPKCCNLNPSSGETLPALAGGGSHRQHGIILCSFTHNFMSKIHYLNGIASSTPPPNKVVHYKIHTLQLIVLLYPLLLFLRPFYTSININTKHKCPA
jgi:hypothetical protein